MLAAEPESVGARLEAAAEGAAGCGIVLTRLEQPGHFLAVLPAGARDAKALGAAAALRWGLSERQREVLERLAEGRSNQAIAVELGCAIGTLELHVSTILERAGAASRAELVARFWTGT
jgi:DNA-binding CsgD family transcriptional regulator